MRRVRSSGTGPELAFRRTLWAKGYRYHVAPAYLPGKPDVVFLTRRVAIFVDGDFWHGNQWRKRKHARLEDQFRGSESKAYWLAKIRRTMARDCGATDALLQSGWTVLRFWESQIRSDVEGCVDMAIRAIEATPARSPYALLPQKTVAEFFAGIGLMRLGLERHGWSVTFSNDIDEQKERMYSEHFRDATPHFLLGDIHQIELESVPTVTLATASFPCNDLSLAGARRGLHGEQSSAFWGFIRILRGMGPRKPPLVLLENVPGFLTSHQGEDFHQALGALNELGYSVDAFVLNAKQFVPQSRQRLFVVGVLEDQSAAREPLPSYTLEALESAARPKALAAFITGRPDIRWNIRPLPAPAPIAPRLDDILEDLPMDAPQWWSQTRADYLFNQMSPRHQDLARGLMAQEQWSFGTVFRRMRSGKSMAELRTDGVAGCLRTPRGGSGRQILVKAGCGHFFARLITPREAARLMGADTYHIAVPVNQALFGFGDAVCVPVIEWIAQYYLNPVVNELIRGQALSAIK